MPINTTLDIEIMGWGCFCSPVISSSARIVLDLMMKAVNKVDRLSVRRSSPVTKHTSRPAQAELPIYNGSGYYPLRCQLFVPAAQGADLVTCHACPVDSGDVVFRLLWGSFWFPCSRFV